MILLPGLIGRRPDERKGRRAIAAGVRPGRPAAARGDPAADPERPFGGRELRRLHPRHRVRLEGGRDRGLPAIQNAWLLVACRSRC